MPLGIFLIWPALHILYGVKEVHSHKVKKSRRVAGTCLLLLSILFVSQPFGWEQGIFYWLFALMALALGFVQLRVFQPSVVKYTTLASVTLLAINLFNDLWVAA